MGLRANTRTQLAAATEPLANGSTPDVLIVNSTGELSSLYKRATLAFVGKASEARADKTSSRRHREELPSSIGPNMQNFKVITREFLSRQAIVQVSDEFELAQKLRSLFGSDADRRELGARARATFEANLGAAQRTAKGPAQVI